MAGAHRKLHDINSTSDHAPGTNGTLLGTESNAIAEKAFGTTATADLIVQRDGAGQLTVPLTPTADNHAVSRSYVLQQAVTGTTWKELVLIPQQLLNGGSGGVREAMAFYLTANLSTGDTINISDGTTTQTLVADTDFSVGGSAAATQTNLVGAITGSDWLAIETTGLDNYFAGTPATQAVVYKVAAENSAGAAGDRMWLSVGTVGNIRVVEFATGNQDYRQSSGTESDIPGSDPGSKRFGFGRAFASLDQNDTHRVAEDNTAYTWDSDDTTWQNTDTGGGVTEGNGIDVTGGKVSTDVAVAVTSQQYGAIVNNRTSDGSATASADAGFLAVQTDNTTLEVNSSNQLQLVAGSLATQYQGTTAFVDNQAQPNDRTPSLSELNSFLGTAASDIGNWGFMQGSTNNTTYHVVKFANGGTISDYYGVELDVFS